MTITRTISKPTFCSNDELQEYLEYLDSLRESGETSMFGARPYLLKDFPELSKDEAGAVLYYWMATFSERHPK